MKIYYHTPVDKQFEEVLINYFTGHTFEFNRKGKVPKLEDIDILVGHNIPLDWIGKCTKLKLIQTDSAGIDHYLSLDLESIKKRGVYLANFAGFFDKPIAEDVLAALLMMMRAMPAVYRQQSLRKWNYTLLRESKRMLHGRAVTLLGYGNIGKEIAHALDYFNCTILPLSSKDFINNDKSRLRSALEESTILISTLPLNEKTLNILDYSSLKLLGSEGIVVNVGRGGTINEDDLIHLLLNRKLYAAYLDVTAQEPIASDSRLWEIDNLFLGQHSASGFEDELEAKISHLAHVLDYFIKNGKPYTLVKI